MVTIFGQLYERQLFCSPINLQENVLYCCPSFMYFKRISGGHRNEEDVDSVEGRDRPQGH
jgi:hypothetical protein